MALSKIFSTSFLSKFQICPKTARSAGLPESCQMSLGLRYLYVRTQPPPPDEHLPEVERVDVDWRHVECLLARQTVPQPVPKERYPSGWVPQTGSDTLSYSVRRSVNHMLPVYLKIKENGVKRLTIVRHVRGDIWLFHNELKKHLESINDKYIASQVNEMGQFVQFKGEYVTQAKEWLKKQGL